MISFGFAIGAMSLPFVATCLCLERVSCRALGPCTPSSSSGDWSPHTPHRPHPLSVRPPRTLRTLPCLVLPCVPPDHRGGPNHYIATQLLPARMPALRVARLRRGAALIQRSFGAFSVAQRSALSVALQPASASRSACKRRLRRDLRLVIHPSTSRALHYSRPPCARQTWSDESHAWLRPALEGASVASAASARVRFPESSRGVTRVCRSGSGRFVICVSFSNG